MYITIIYNGNIDSNDSIDWIDLKTTTIKLRKNIFFIYILIVILQYNNKEMGLTKSEIFTEEQNNIAVFAKAIGHPARVAILQHLIKINSCICGDLVEEIGLAQPTISQHLKELKNIGIIKGNIEGTSVCYCIDQTNWSKMKNMIQTFLNQDFQKANCC